MATFVPKLGKEYYSFIKPRDYVIVDTGAQYLNKCFLCWASLKPLIWVGTTYLPIELFSFGVWGKQQAKEGGPTEHPQYLRVVWVLN